MSSHVTEIAQQVIPSDEQYQYTTVVRVYTTVLIVAVQYCSTSIHYCIDSSSTLL